MQGQGRISVGQMRKVLKDHYLQTIVCDHDRKMDNAICQCSMVNLGWHPSIGQAVDAWVEHVIFQITRIMAPLSTTPEDREDDASV